MCLAQGAQGSDACEAQTRGPTVSSQALYHRANHPVDFQTSQLPQWCFAGGPMVATDCVLTVDHSLSI